MSQMVPLTVGGDSASLTLPEASPRGRIVFSPRLMLAILAACSPIVAAEPSFKEQVAPILQKHCVSCHSSDRRKGDLDITSRAKLLEGGANGVALVPGKPGESRLVQMVAQGKMPPKQPLSADEAKILGEWVAAGAKWEGEPLMPSAAGSVKRAGPDWWSLQPIRRPMVPPSVDRTWTENPIDAFVRAGLDAAKLSPSPEADRRTLIRRATMDLTGLWPTPDEVAAFEADRSPRAYEALIDRLLASSAYGERWGRHWLDVVRFAESHGYEMNTLRPNAWPYRDYVIRAFNNDLSFRQFVREQLAGDKLGGDELSQAATGFLVAGAHDLVGNQTVEGMRQQRSDDLFDMVSTTSTAFLGLTVGCARCHDHKFDPVAQRDFYAMESIFAGVRHAERPIGAMTPERVRELVDARAKLRELEAGRDMSEPNASPTPGLAKARPRTEPTRNVERFAPRQMRFVRFTVLATNDGSQPCIDEIEIFSGERNVAIGGKATASSEYPNAAIHKVPHLNDGKVGNSHSWISAEPGKGWAQIELSEAFAVNLIVWARDRLGTYKDRLPVDYRIESSIDGKAWSPIAGSWDRDPKMGPGGTKAAEIKAIRDKIAALEKAPSVYAGQFGPPEVTRLLKRGDVMQPADVMVPGAIRGIGPELRVTSASDDHARRLALADWLTDASNPLPSRVWVNRIWHHHFGAGLVRTPSDFGFNGDRPSHPELLDWLAAEFQANGGQSKPLHRLIMTSRTYRQTSAGQSSGLATDASNRMLWRYPSRRIEAEAIRDNILRTTGSLENRGGGPGYNLWEYSNYVTVFKPKEKLGPDEFRRMVYQFKPRTQQDSTFGAFDCPDATATAPRRLASTTALQALNLLNSPFIFDQADRFARLIGAQSNDPQQQVGLAFLRAFQRKPSASEQASARRLVEQSNLATLCRMLLNANELVTLE